MKNKTDNLVFCNQKHDVDISCIEKKDIYLGSTKIVQENGIDDLITKEKNIYLVIVTADCIPVFFYDQKKKIVSIAHCGWKGIINGLAIKVLFFFQQKFQSSLQDIIVTTGPFIQKCCYKVDKAEDNRIQLFKNTFGTRIENKGYLNLQQSLFLQLQQHGIKEGNIIFSKDCTC